MQSSSLGNALLPLFVRVALAASFLSAVADRFGFYGPPESAQVAWGSFENFAAYTGTLLMFVPSALVGSFAWLATGLELGLAVLLLLGLFTRQSALLAAVLLLSFAFAMTVSLGFKAPLDYSVWSAAAAALCLAKLGPGMLSLDARSGR